MHEALAPVLARRGDPGDIERLRLALLDPPRALPDTPPAVLAEVEAFLVENPAATRGDVLASVRRRRGDVLAAFRQVREAGVRYPSPPRAISGVES